MPYTDPEDEWAREDLRRDEDDDFYWEDLINDGSSRPSAAEGN